MSSPRRRPGRPQRVAGTAVLLAAGALALGSILLVGPSPLGESPSRPADPTSPEPPGAVVVGTRGTASATGSAPISVARAGGPPDLAPPPISPPVRAEAAAGPLVEPGGSADATPSGLVDGAVDRTSLDLDATYAVRAAIGWASRRLAVTTTIAIRNKSGGLIDHVLLNTVAGPLGHLRGLSATVDGRPVPATAADQTIRVPFGGALPDGGSTEVVVRYEATIRSDLAGPSDSAWLFTRTNGILALYRWIPWLSREHPFARPNHGDPFVTVTSPRVTLELVADRPLRYAINARRIHSTDGGRRQVFVAERVRDVVLTAAPDYRVLRGRVGDTEIEVVARPGTPAAALLAQATTAIRRLERLLGPHPYRRLVVAESAGGYALEGPGIVWIPRGVATSRLPYLVTHEIGHQWFYGLVGSDQAADPFADEAVTDMVTRYVLGLRRAPRCTSGRLDRSIYAYSAACYYERIYIAGGNLLDDLRRRMGTTAFFGALQTYLDEHRFGLGSTADLVATLDAATPLAVRAFLGRLLPSLRAGGR
jgi:hypothetical protein